MSLGFNLQREGKCLLCSSPVLETIFAKWFSHLAMHGKFSHVIQLNFPRLGISFFFFQLMWIGMQETSWRLPRSFSFILSACNVRISQQKLKCLERYGSSLWNVFDQLWRLIYFSSKLILYVLFMQEIALMEEELNIKNELIKKQENLIQEWKKELKDQLDKHKIELDRV